MLFRESTLDDLLYVLFSSISTTAFDQTPTRALEHGNTSEIIGATLILDNPRARLSRSENRGKIISLVGELLWYLSGTNDLSFIKYYIPNYRRESEDGKTVYGGYGPRFFKHRQITNQVENVIKLLKKNPSTRRAVIQVFDAQDIEIQRKEIPCTCTLQFLIRNGKLHMVVFMRSNDVYRGLPHDIFCFTMLQELILRSISGNLELGEYHHHVGSLHLYESNLKDVESYLHEGFQSTLFPMHPMPTGDPWSSVTTLLESEVAIKKDTLNFDRLSLDKYWMDIIGLLLAFRLGKLVKDRKVTSAEAVKKIKSLGVDDRMYGIYIQDRINKIESY